MNIHNSPSLKTLMLFIMGIIFTTGMMPLVFADVYVNVMAVNGANAPKETQVRFNLPGDLKAEDILDTNGLDLDYDVNDHNFFVHGLVKLEAKGSQTFRIRVRDAWKLNPEEFEGLKKQIEQGYNQLGVPNSPEKAELLKKHLLEKLNYIIEGQAAKSGSVEGRIDAYRAQVSALQRIRKDAMGVDYWRSNPEDQIQEKLVRMNIEVENPATNNNKTVKHKHFLPLEVKPEHLVDFEGFEIRYDEKRNQLFLFKEEDITPGEKKLYSIGIRDVWFVSQIDINYLRQRSDYAYGFLKTSKYADGAKYLYDQIGEGLAKIEASQAQQREIKSHISAYRENQQTFEQARTDVESLEKLLAAFRENLEKSKVKNVLKNISSIKSLGDLSKVLAGKSMGADNAWAYMGWVMGFVGLLIFGSFIFWMLRSKGNKKDEKNGDEPAKSA